MMAQSGDKDLVEAGSGPSVAGAAPRRSGSSSRDAASSAAPATRSDLEANLKKLRLENEDLRFDRDRYQASAAQYQGKLILALKEVNQGYVYRDQVRRTRREVVSLAQEFAERLDRERNATAEADRRVRALELEIERLKHEHDERLRQEIAAPKEDGERQQAFDGGRKSKWMPFSASGARHSGGSN